MSGERKPRVPRTQGGRRTRDAEPRGRRQPQLCTRRCLAQPEIADELAQRLAVVASADAAHGPGAGAGHERLGGRAARPLVAHALEQVAVGDAGAREELVLAAAEAVLVEPLLEVVALVDRGLALVLVARPEAGG